MRRRSGRAKDMPFVEPDLPITPMLDMSFQLLAFFLTTFNPSPSEGHLDLSLPSEKGGGAAVPSFSPDEEDEITVQVASDANGGITGIEVMNKGDAQGTKLGNDSAKLFAFLKERLKSSGKAGKLKLEMGETLSYQFVVKLVDECTRAGYRSVAPSVLNSK
jgi:biopolymer transport protein ExbD